MYHFSHISGFSIVYKGNWKGTTVAVKKLKFQQLTTKSKASFLNEVEIMSKLRHPNICLMLGVCIESPNISIMLEYVPRGSLFSILHDKKVKLDFLQICKLSKDIGAGVNYLHQLKIVHHDLNSKVEVLYVLILRTFYLILTGMQN